MIRFFYSLLLTLALPLILLRLGLRSLAQPGYRWNMGERFGFFSTRAPAGAVWVHAVSVGEARAAKPLVDALRARYPGRAILLTCMTPAGRRTAEELFGGTVHIAYLPYDLAIWQRAFIRRHRPALLLIMETEIWPNLYAACASERVPALLVNARLSERSRAGYARFTPVRSLAREALSSLAAVSAQSSEDAARLTSLGAKDVHISGNLKFDFEADPHKVLLGQGWRAGLARPQVLLMASTREGEEAQLLAAYLRAFDEAARARTLLVLVPRHPQRFDTVWGGLQATGLPCARRAQSEIPPADCDAWLGDSMGEMSAYFAMCDLAIVGGSFENLGGQNFIEAAALGKPVLLGPHTFNFAEATALGLAEGAVMQVANAEAALNEARKLLDNPARCKAMSEAALRFAGAHKGATQKTMELIAPLLSH